MDDILKKDVGVKDPAINKGRPQYCRRSKGKRSVTGMHQFLNLASNCHEMPSVNLMAIDEVLYISIRREELLLHGLPEERNDEKEGCGASPQHRPPKLHHGQVQENPGYQHKD